MTSPIDRLATQLAALQQQLRDISRTPALAYSSIDNGALTVTQTTTDASGNPTQQVTAIIGQQYDGTSGAVVVAGPKPPKPAPCQMQSVVGGVQITSDGSFAPDGSGRPVVAPMDFESFEVEVSDDPAFPGLVGHGRFGASGGTVTVAWHPVGTPLYARLRTLSKAGKYSDPSDTSGPVDSGPVGIADLGFNISDYAGGTTIYYGPDQPTAPSGGFTPGDMWLEDTGQQGTNGQELFLTYRWDGTQWTLLQDQGISQSLAQAVEAQTLANGKVTWFTQGAAPSYSGAAYTAVWIDTANDNRTNIWSGTGWTTAQIGNGAIHPQSLIASNVIATGTVTSALLEATLILATTIIAGDANGTHAAMQSDGFHVYDQSGSEVIRLGTTSNDYFGVVDSSGTLIASIDDAGSINSATANFREDIVVAGADLLGSILPSIPGGGGAGTTDLGARNYVGWDTTGTAIINGVTSEVGLIEVAVTVDTGRVYWIVPSLYWTASSSNTYLTVTVRDGGTSSPTINSPTVAQDFYSTGNNPNWTLLAERHRPWIFPTGGQHRLLLTVAGGGGGSINVVNTGNGQVPMLTVIDMGPYRGNPASVNRGGGGSSPPPPPPSPLQQYDTGWMAPAGYASWRGNGTLRSDTTDVVQGWDPSGFNGDGSGYWWWNLPSITGTVNNAYVWLQSNSTYYNSGGTGILAPIKSGATYPVSNYKLAGNYNVPGFPKPGTLQVDISGWAGLFANSQGANRAVGISVGPSGGTNETFYVRFDGPAARLRLLFTQ